jgi:hypothetical protein
MTPENSKEKPEIPAGDALPEIPEKYFDLAHLKNAVPAFLLASAYAMTGLGRYSILGFNGQTLADLLKVELIAVFFGFFILAMIIALKRNRDREMMVRISATLGFTIAVAVGLSFIAGPWGPFLLIPATLGTYWSPCIRWYNDESISNSVVRAVIILVLYCFWVFLAYRPEIWADLLKDTRHTHIAGLLYFLCLGILEWAGDMDNV